MSSREPVTLWEFQTLLWSLPCHQFLCSCSETHVLPKQHGRSFEHEVPSCSPEIKGSAGKYFHSSYQKYVLFLKEAFQFVRDKPFLLPFGKGVGNIRPSERWRLLTSPYGIKTFSFGIPEDDFDFSGDGRPLLIYMKHTSLAAFFFFPPLS